MLIDNQIISTFFWLSAKCTNYKFECRRHSRSVEITNPTETAFRRNATLLLFGCKPTACSFWVMLFSTERKSLWDLKDNLQIWTLFSFAHLHYLSRLIGIFTLNFAVTQKNIPQWICVQTQQEIFRRKNFWQIVIANITGLKTIWMIADIQKDLCIKYQTLKSM